LTYSTGAAIACSAVLGRLEAIGLLLFLPHVFDAVMVVKYSLIERKTGIEAFAKVTDDGSLDMPYDRIYGFEHLGLWLAKHVKSKVAEGDVVRTILGIEFLLASIILGFRLLGVL
jgi:UDP-N-acetylglucosamine--dolichyl-phosphate N-acetylglucosaminephosphotransferase